MIYVIGKKKQQEVPTKILRKEIVFIHSEGRLRFHNTVFGGGKQRFSVDGTPTPRIKKKIRFQIYPD